VNVIKVEEIQSKLKSKEIFIEYKLIDSLLFTFSITNKGVALRKEILEADFKDKIVSFISSINKFPVESFDKEDYLEFIYLGNDLYRTLLDPLVQPDQYSKIFIIPDNILGYLPFEALINEYFVPENIDFKNLNYVLKSFTISYSYSGTLIFKNLSRNRSNSKLLAMAPVYNSISNLESDAFKVDKNLLSQLNQLDYSIDEVTNIGSLIQGSILTGGEATETNFKKKSGQYGILHFAMHTLINDESPMNSKLIFTLNNDTTDDGFLNAYEIYNLNLNASLAVLSACKTGIGKYSKGEGIMSIAWGFLFAGVPSIVMTLWEIEDISGSKIMYRFYKYLQSGLPTDEALRNAKLDYLISSDPLQSHPYFWAAYVQIGQTEPVITFTKRNKTEILVSALFLIAFLIIFKRMISNRENNLS
jgi:CHAT domain-containing protein